MRSTLLTGLLISSVVVAGCWGIWGPQAAFAAGIFGAFALLIQLAAIALIQPVKTAAPKLFIKRWGIGMGLRFLGVVAIAVAAGLDPAHFPPIPAAIGFLGVLLPLLFFEVRLVR
jgi:hypothetical protein